MNEEYTTYLFSEGWRAKRLERLRAARFRCEACGATGGLEVHHVTYARVFKESVDDLLVLCRRHHKEVERMVRLGNIPREGDALKLAGLTLRLLRGSGSVANLPAPLLRLCRNKRQRFLLSRKWFVKVLGASRERFKAALNLHHCRKKRAVAAWALFNMNNRRHEERA